MSQAGLIQWLSPDSMVDRGDRGLRAEARRYGGASEYLPLDVAYQSHVSKVLSVGGLGTRSTTIDSIIGALRCPRRSRRIRQQPGDLRELHDHAASTTWAETVPGAGDSLGHTSDVLSEVDHSAVTACAFHWVVAAATHLVVSEHHGAVGDDRLGLRSARGIGRHRT